MRRGAKMEKIIVRGGERLAGEVLVSGAKNASLSIMAASLLTKERVSLENVPNLTDVSVMSEMLQKLGAKVERREGGKMEIICNNITSYRAPYELVKRMRASFHVAGPLLSRFGQAEVPLPGGCVIGSRPVDLHIKGFKILGAEVEVEYGYMKAKVDRLQGNNIYLDPRWCSVGTTTNILIAATLAEGVTMIENAARDPEIADLANFLIKMGAEIKGAGTSTIEIKGVKELKGCSHRIVPDRIEAGTYLVAGAITKGDVSVEGLPAGYVETVTQKLREAGCEIRKDINKVRVIADKDLYSVDITTAPYPGFPTDMQPSLVALMSRAEGVSVVEETIHDSRFRYVDELRRMGANIKMVDNTAVVKGVKKLTGAPVETTDLRAGAALVLAGLSAVGETEVSGIEHIDRGYERLEEKLTQLGAKIKRVKNGY